MRKSVFYRPLSILLAVILTVSVFTILPVTTVSAANTVTDTLTASLFGLGGSYSEVREITASSNAVYSCRGMKNGSAIQFNTSKASNKGGIISTSTGGKAKNVTVTWKSGTTGTIDIYGKNSAYSSYEDLFSTSSATKGTNLGSIASGTSTELNITGNYTYIGLRSVNGAVYLDEVKITWETSSTPSTYTVTWKDGDGNTKETDTDVASGTKPEYNGGTPTKSSDANYS